MNKARNKIGTKRKMKNTLCSTINISPVVQLDATIMVLWKELLFTVSMQQLACKLHGHNPVNQFAFLSTTCPVSALLTNLLGEYELALEIIIQCILASAVGVNLRQSPVCINTRNTVSALFC